MKSPRISVVIPVYNGEPFIAATIESVLAQRCADFELVIMDNVSTDRTCEVVRGFADPRVRLCESQQHVGPGANFNRALGQARGEFVKLLPADDILYPSCLQQQLDVLADPQNAGIVMVSCLRDVIDEQGRLVHRPKAKLQGRVAGIQAIRRNIRSGANIVGEPLAVLMRRSDLEQIGGFDDAIPFMLDMDLWCRLLLRGDLFALTEPMAAFRISRSSMSFMMLGKQTVQYHRFIDERRAKPQFQLTLWDACLGKTNSFIREILRWGAYTCYLRR